MKNTSIQSKFSALKLILKTSGYKPNEQGWWEGRKLQTGFLRVDLCESDCSMGIFRLTKNGCLEWKMEMEMNAPESVLVATLKAAMNEANA